MKIPFLGGWTSMNPSYFDVNYRCTIGFDTLPYVNNCNSNRSWFGVNNMVYRRIGTANTGILDTVKECICQCQHTCNTHTDTMCFLDRSASVGRSIFGLGALLRTLATSSWPDYPHTQIHQIQRILLLRHTPTYPASTRSQFHWWHIYLLYLHTQFLDGF